MRNLRLALAVSVAAGLMAVTGTATAFGASGTSAGDLYGVGGGKAFGILVQFSFSAHEGPNGDFGQAVIKNDAFLFSATFNVDCVTVFRWFTFPAGAWFSGTVKKLSGPNMGSLGLGDRADFLIWDGGPPSNTPVDFFNGVEVPLNYTCKLDAPDYPPPNVTQGNVLVSDS